MTGHLDKTRRYRPGIRRAAACLVFCALLLLFFAFDSFARDWDHPGFETGHISTMYTIRNGMPYSEVNAAAQTEDGFMYFGGYGGLVQYDGRSFHKYDEVSSVVSLYADPDGSLWIGTNDSGFAHMTPQAEFTFYGKEAGLKTLSVRSIMPDGLGNLFFATTSGLYYMKNYKEEGDALFYLDDGRLNDKYIYSLAADRKGTIYGVTEDGSVFSVKDFKIDQYRISAETGAAVTCVCPDHTNSSKIYLGTEGEFILYGNLSEMPESYSRIETPNLSSANMLKQIDGKLWICTNSGIGYMDGDDGYQLLSLTPLTMVEGVLKDYEGNLWFYSYRNGILKVCLSVFTDVSLMTDMKDRVVTTTWMKNDLLYTGTDTGLLVFGGDGEQVETPVSEMLRTARVRAIKEDRNGNLWFCTFSDHGLVCMHPDGSYTRFNRYNGLLTDHVRTIYEQSDGTLVVSVSGGGIQFIKDERIVRTLSKREGMPNTDTLTITEDKEGRLYLGTNGNGIYIVDGDEIYPFRGEYPLRSRIILRLKRDDSRNCIWVVTSNEVGILEDGNVRRIRNIPTSDLASGCYDILLADNGNIWMLGGTGIYVADGDELKAGTLSDYRFYDVKNGLPHITTANSRSYVSPEGRAYIAGLDGITGIDLNNKERVIRRVKLAVPYIEADGKRIYTVPGQEITLPYQTKRVVIYSFALSYAMGNPVVAHYLEGFDELASIVPQAQLYPRTYTNLPGGRYTFHLKSVNQISGDSYGVDVVIVKEKAFYEKTWFWLLIGAVVLGFIVLIVNQLLWLQQKKLEKKREDERISSELSMASDIQVSALPGTFPAFPERTDFDIYASMKPAREVGGDFYDFFLIDDDHLGMVMADVSDKGVPAALYMMSAKISISDFAMMGKSPAEVLTAVNNVLTRNPSEMFVTVWVGVLDLRTGELAAANAGHEYPILMRPGGSFELMKDKHGVVLGGMEGIRYRQYTLQLEPGAKLFLYTDGVPEANNTQQKFFGLDRTLEALNGAKDGTPEEILKAVHDAVNAFAGDAPQFDDLTMMCVHFKGKNPQ